MSAFRACLWAVVIFTGAKSVHSAPVSLNTNLQIRFLLSTTNSTGSHSVRLAKDPRDNQLYYLKDNGDIFQVHLQAGSGTSTATKLYSSADHGLASSVQGMAIGPDGTIYVLANTSTPGTTAATIMKGVPSGGGRSWSLLARTEPYQLSRTAFDHLCNGIVVSPDGQSLYMNSGSRTDHGEVETAGGLYPDTREVPLTAKIFRIPVNASGLVLSNDLTFLRNGGYIFAEGIRNSFDLAFAPNGDLFGTENGPDRDMSDELNWLRAGAHYGFPWRLGGADNPQQFPGYDPTTDLLLDPRYVAVATGAYHNDPTFPSPPPTNFAEPVINVGPDADSYRNPADGTIQDASSNGLTLSTFTAHRSPLGLVFDTAAAMAPPFENHAFMLSWTAGDPNGNSVPGPFKDASQDMVDLDLSKLGTTNYQARVTRLVGGFSNPIDAEIISNRVFVIEYGGIQSLWEVSFPPGQRQITLSASMVQPDGTLLLSLTGAVFLTYRIQTSSDLVTWEPFTNFTTTTNPFSFADLSPTNHPVRFYRAVQP